MNGRLDGTLLAKHICTASCGKFDEASANCVERGFTFGIHNHWWEFIEVDGELVYSKPETGEVLELFTELMGSDVPRYGEE